MAQIEFFTDANGVIFFREDNRTRELTETEFGIITDMIGIIKRKFPITYETLVKLYHGDRMMIVKRFIVCNLMNDDTVSFDLNGANMYTEDVKCPLRGGLCQFEGKICRVRSQIKLNNDELEVVQLLQKGCDYNEIAKILFVSVDSVRKRMSRLMKRIGAKNRYELITLLA